MRPPRLAAPALATAALLAAQSCDVPARDAPPAPPAASPSSSSATPRPPFGPALSHPTRPVEATMLSNRVDTAELLFASGELQISGEPFVERFAGRTLAAYDRRKLPPDRYDPDVDPATLDDVVDDFGYSLAVESYEYSKYHMNVVAFQSGAGVSLAYGAFVDRGGSDAEAALRDRVQRLIVASGADIGGFAVVPAPSSNPLNVLGFGGLAPVYLPFTSFDPSVRPDGLVANGCSFEAGYGATALGFVVPDYECGYSTLHLPDPIVQATPSLSPEATGFFLWKLALWGIDFAGRLHDTKSNPVDEVQGDDLSLVGKASNQVRPVGEGLSPGVYLGSTPLEGLWGLVLLDEIDNAAATLVGKLTTTDGVALGGVGVSDALAYHHGSPLRWFPARVDGLMLSARGFAQLSDLSIGDPSSRARDLSALLLGASIAFSMTDARNSGVGQRIGLRAAFDGDPFAADDGVADAESTLHDRLLALLKIALVDIDRLHAVAPDDVLVDRVTVEGGVLRHGRDVTTAQLAHATIALRQALLALGGAVTQYGGEVAPPDLDDRGILNGTAWTLSGAKGPSHRLRALCLAQARAVRDRLTLPDGTAFAGGALDANGALVADREARTLEGQTAAIRALVEGFLLSGDESFRERAQAVARALERDFFSDQAGLYREVAGGADEVTMTPHLYALLQSALRETYKSLAVPGDAALDRAVLERRMARVGKLFLNGFDDRDADRAVSPGECLGARLQLAEQTLTGELGAHEGALSSDRDGDCVLEIDDAGTLATLASRVRFAAP